MEKNLVDTKLKRFQYIRDYLTKASVQILDIKDDVVHQEPVPLGYPEDSRVNGRVEEGNYLEATVTILLPYPALPIPRSEPSQE